MEEGADMFEFVGEGEGFVNKSGNLYHRGSRSPFKILVSYCGLGVSSKTPVFTVLFSA